MYFNDINFNHHFKILDVRRPLLPPITRGNINVPKLDGSYPITKSNLEEYTIEVDIEVKADSRYDMRSNIRNIANLLFTREEKELRFNDELDKYYMAKLSGESSLKQFYNFGTATLTFIASNPYAYSDKKIISIVNKETLFLDGSVETYPKFNITIKSNISNLKINNLSLGRYVLINRSFNIGDLVEIDFSAKWKVKRNGYNEDKYVTIESDFFKLNVGENNLMIEPSGQEVEMEYKEGWI